jgi:ApbE superfamily uncharacterized protein (UPF0280 family)
LKVFKTHFLEQESDVTIISESKTAIKKAKESFYIHRRNLENYILSNKSFLTSFSPIRVNTKIKIINLMTDAAYICDVGPMAAVAGALADLMLDVMKNQTNNSDFEFTPAKIALVENGGEIAIDSIEPMKIGLYAGSNELGAEIGFLIEKADCPIGIGTSSATVGHAISLGQADAVTVFANTATLADAAATRVANLVKGTDIEASIKKGLDIVDDLDGVQGAFISREDKVGHTGKLPKFIKIEGDRHKLLKGKLNSFLSDDTEVFR